jgi:hypothetical protein
MLSEEKPVRIIPDKVHPKMYRLEWEDGVLSEDMYNWTRTNDILNNYDEYVNNMNKRDPAYTSMARFHQSERL